MAGKKRAQIRDVVAPLENEVGDLDWLVDRYRQERTTRQDRYNDEALAEIERQAEESGRSFDDITLPYNWAPPGDPPRPLTPWQFKDDILDEVIALFLDGTIDSFGSEGSGEEGSGEEGIPSDGFEGEGIVVDD